jgi:phospholipid/cholesterol/gamma-HCH transport system substrate-binding protein
VNNRNFVVGIFVSSALAALVVLSLWLSGRHGNTDTTTYSMYFERDVTGLMLGGPVFYLGVEVGNVTRTEIIPGDPMTVRVDIAVLSSTPIDTGTWASLFYQGITGVAVINLYGDPGMNLPLKTPPGLEHPVINVRDAGLAAVLADAPAIMAKLDDLLERAATLLGGENRALITETLGNLEALTASLADKEEAFARLPGEINTTLAEFRQSLVLLQDTVGEMRPGISATLDNLSAASASLAAATDRLEQWTVEHDEEIGAFAEGGLGQVPALVTDTRAALRELEKLMRSLREDPSRLIYRPEEGGDEDD